MTKKQGLIRKGYISELDQFLQEFDKKHSQFGESRLKEIKKHQEGIFKKRDEPSI